MKWQWFNIRVEWCDWGLGISFEWFPFFRGISIQIGPFWWLLGFKER
ncbi:hypothetical protein LCGC14_1066510 [marine sediment metagenome]|uniref:Uncharacterized protein n=1 Tax=marine sediment metagenome TaxID=412755 RepID=A0A0F9N6N1_9ZZZZ